MGSESSLYFLAARTVELPAFFGALLYRFRQQENISEEDVLRHLRTTPAMLARLALCRLPNSASPDFAAQMRQIAAFTQTDAELLIRMVRQVEAVEELSRPHNVVRLQRRNETQSSGEGGLLAAARDWESNAEPPPKSTESSQEDDQT